MQKAVIRAADYGKGKKRVNISLGIDDYESLVELAGEKGIVVPGTYALSLLTQAIREEKKKSKPKELPGQTHLFNRKKHR